MVVCVSVAARLLGTWLCPKGAVSLLLVAGLQRYRGPPIIIMVLNKLYVDINLYRSVHVLGSTFDKQGKKKNFLFFFWLKKAGD